LFPLNIFPQYSLSSSIITTVWVGVFIISFFNLRFGWVMSGLVVPGYLVPILLIKPWAALIIVTQGIIAYWLIWLYSEYFSEFGKWHNFFGRDRFFAILLASVLTKIVFDLWVLPQIGVLLDHYNIQFDYRNNLHSFGLIVVALIANQFWKPGVVRGMLPLLVCIGLTYLIVRYVFIEFTNFSIENLGYVFEDIASSIVAAPKAYIVMLTTAYIASYINLRYAWEFNGILIPSLIALQWYSPLKILSTVVEAIIILLAAYAILRTPFFKRMTMEGARKIMLFFNISYVYKFILAYIILWIFPEQKITDLYGLGYLLPTLIAVKVHDKGIPLKITRAIIQTSFLAVLVASIIGYTLTWIPKLIGIGQDIAPSGDITPIKEEKGTLAQIIHDERLHLYKSRKVVVPLPDEVEAFVRGIKILDKYLRSHDTLLFKELEQAHDLLKSANFRLRIINQKYLLISEKEPYRGWGIFLIRISEEKGPAIEVPMPLGEWGSVNTAQILFQKLKGKTLAIAGSPFDSKNNNSKNSKNGYSYEVFKDHRTIFQAFHKVFGRRDVVQIRTESVKKVMVNNQSTIWVRSNLPSTLDLRTLKSIAPNLQVKWGSTSDLNIQRETTIKGFSELFLHKSDVVNLLTGSIDLFARSNESLKIKVIEEPQEITGLINDWMDQQKILIAEKGSNKYILPSVGELLFFSEEVLTPLLQLIIDSDFSTQLDDKHLKTLLLINTSASLMGYQLLKYRDTQNKKEYIILIEKDEVVQRKYWGVYIFRIGESLPYLVQVPRPVSERFILEYGLMFFNHIQAKALLISGTHPDANIDGTSQIFSPPYKSNLFNLVTQSILREYKESEFMSVLCRSINAYDVVLNRRANVLVSFLGGFTSYDKLSFLEKTLIDDIKVYSPVVEIVNGSSAYSGYEFAASAASGYVNHTINKGFATIWISKVTRRKFKKYYDNRSQAAQIKALEIPVLNENLLLYMRDKSQIGRLSPRLKKYRNKIQQYIDTRDVSILYNMSLDKTRIHLKNIVDTNTKQSFLLMFDRKMSIIMLVNLYPTNTFKTKNLKKDSFKWSEISHFINTKNETFLEFN